MAAGEGRERHVPRRFRPAAENSRPRPAARPERSRRDRRWHGCPPPV